VRAREVLILSDRSARFLVNSAASWSRHLALE